MSVDSYHLLLLEYQTSVSTTSSAMFQDPHGVIVHRGTRVSRTLRHTYPIGLLVGIFPRTLILHCDLRGGHVLMTACHVSFFLRQFFT